MGRKPLCPRERRIIIGPFGFMKATKKWIEINDSANKIRLFVLVLSSFQALVYYLINKWMHTVYESKIIS